MAIEFNISGIDKVKKTGQNFSMAGHTVKDLIFKAAGAFAVDAHKRITEEYMSGPHPEKIQPVTNRLRSSIKFRVARSENEIGISFGTDVPYAAIHEFGGNTGRNHKTYIRPRPYLRPGVEDAIPDFQEEVENILRKAAKGAFENGG